MNSLADLVLDYYLLLEYSEEDFLPDLDQRVKLEEHLVCDIENECSDEERRAIQRAAARRLSDLTREPDEYGYTPRALVTPELRSFLEAIAAGHFHGSIPDSE